MTRTNYNTHHKRSASSVTTLSASAAKYPEKIERLQAFDKWKSEKTDLGRNVVISAIYVHLSHRVRGNFAIECTGPSGHWMIEKSLKQLAEFQRNLCAAFPVEAGITGKPRILPKIAWSKCPKWLLLKKEVHCWYRYQIERFMRLLLECSPLVSKSRLVEEFLGSDLLTAEEEQEEMTGKKLRISAPMSDKSVLRCCLGEVDFNEFGLGSIITIIYDNEVYPLVNVKSLEELHSTFSFLSGRKQFVAKNGDELVSLDADNFSNFNADNNQLLYMEILHDE